MKKIIAVLSVLALVVSFAACGKNAAETDTTTEAEITSQSSDNTEAAISEAMSGMYAIDTESNKEADLVAAFGDSVKDGGQMLIGTDGYFDFDIGTAIGGTGKVECDGNVLTAVFEDRNGNEGTAKLTYADGKYTMNINDVDVIWCVNPENDGDEDVTVTEAADKAVTSVEELNALLGSKLGKPGAMGVTDEKFAVEGEGENQVSVYTFKIGEYTYNFRATKSSDTEYIVGSSDDGDSEYPQDNDGIAYKTTASEKLAWWKVGDISYGLTVNDNGSMDMDMFKGCAEELQAITK